MRNIQIIFLFLFANSLEIASAFVNPTTTRNTILNENRSRSTLSFKTIQNIHIRGGDISPIDTSSTSSSSSTSTSLNSVTMASTATAITSAIQSGPMGILALSSIATSVVLPLTMIRQGYSFSVGYGLSVFAMGLALSKIFQIPVCITTIPTSPLSLFALSVMFYGMRLGSFLFIREYTVPSKQKAVKSFDKSPRLKRIPLALSVSIFYAFLTSPLMYAARNGPDALSGSIVTKIGIGLAWIGAIIEAVADTHKYILKRNKDESKSFVGPTGGVYRLCRHPNYFGEVLYWFGVAVAGMPSFGTQYLAWGYAGLGFYGIYFIMTSATKRLAGNQMEKYKGQQNFDDYVKDVPATIWPWASS